MLELVNHGILINFLKVEQMQNKVENYNWIKEIKLSKCYELFLYSLLILDFFINENILNVMLI
jgi:hypothetical protein